MGLGYRGLCFGFDPRKWHVIANIRMCNFITCNFGEIAHESWAAIRHFSGGADQTLIEAKDGPNFPNLHPPRECVCKWSQKCGIPSLE